METCGLSFLVRHNNSIKSAVPFAKHNEVIKPVKEIWVRAASGLQKVWTSVTLVITGNMVSVPSGQFYRDQGEFSVTESGGAAITSRSWSIQNDTGGSLLSYSGADPNKFYVRGLFYNTSDPTIVASADIVVVATIGGSTYTQSKAITYTVSGLN